MPKAKPTQKQVEDLSYEEALAELEEIVNALENDQHPLDESIKMYERGQALAMHCNTLLDAAQLHVQTLAGESLVEFEDETE